MNILVISALISLLGTGVFVKISKSFNLGKEIRAEGPETHLKKQGTPTMGGIVFILVALWVPLAFLPDIQAWLPLGVLIGAAALLGFLDDFAALNRKKQQASDTTTGTLARYHIVGQLLIGALFGTMAVNTFGTEIFGNVWVDIPFIALVITGSMNAFNFTDGLDGLAAGVSAIILLFFLPSPFAFALLGGLLGFLWYNAHPARVIMGGVGSETLGAAIAGLAIIHNAVWYLPLVAVVPVLEVVSVMMQVPYFKLTGGKRLFKMTPIHHHFELSGWPEINVTIRFWLITAVAVAAAAWIRGF